MSVRNTITKLQSFHLGIPGIITAPTEYPGSISNAQLPCVITVPNRAITTQLTSGGSRSGYQNPALRSERSYSVRVFVEAVGQNDYDTPSQRSIDLLDIFLREYYSRFPLLPGFAEILSVQDSGIISGGEYVSTIGLTYAGQQYKGFSLEVSVVEVL